ncbi:MAG: FecR domain-containing protein [Marinifilaceae bacterium]
MKNLLYKYITDNLSIREKSILNEWKGQSSANANLLNTLLDKQSVYTDAILMDKFDVKLAKERIESKIRQKQRRRLCITVSSIAASICVIAGGVLLMLNPDYGQNSTGDTIQLSEAQSVTYISSRGEQYSLIDDKVIEDVENRVDAQPNVLTVTTNATVTRTKVSYNSVQVPVQKTFTINLPDGTVAYLNSSTTLRFRTDIATASTREVLLDGEAYFDVKSDSQRPFVVTTPRSVVKVLGTGFNVSTYGYTWDQITLVEGKVSVGGITPESASVHLCPGQQAKINTSISVADVDVQKVLAWRNDEFVFRNTNLEEVMNTLGKWYGFSCFFQHNDLKHLIYSARFSRQQTLDDILESFSLLRECKFIIADKVVTVEAANNDMD